VRSYRSDLLLFFEEELKLNPNWKFQSIAPIRALLAHLQNLDNRKVLIVSGRGGGKTLLCAGLSLWATVPLALYENYPFSVVILGGSKRQSDIAYEHIRSFLRHSKFLSEYVEGEILKTEVRFRTGGYIKPIPKSPVAVRGLHPDWFIFDEAAEIDAEIIKAALPCLSTSKHPRIIFASTPHVLGSYFEGLWSEAQKRGYEVFTWTSLDVPWTDKEQIEADRKELGVRWKTEYLARRVELEEALIDAKSFRDSIIERVSFDATLPSVAGIDWGENYTAFVLLQKQQDYYYVIKSDQWRRADLAKLTNSILKDVNVYDIDTLYADASHPGLNLRLKERGVHLRAIQITSELKRFLQDRLVEFFQARKLKIPKENEELLRQLSKYTRETKKDDHLVDALMLALEGTKILEKPKRETGLPVVVRRPARKRKVLDWLV